MRRTRQRSRSLVQIDTSSTVEFPSESHRKPLGAAKREKSSRRRPTRLKAKLGLPDLEQAKAAVLASLLSPESQRSYGHSIDEFVLWYCSEPRLSFNKTIVTRFRIHLDAT